MKTILVDLPPDASPERAKVLQAVRALLPDNASAVVITIVPAGKGVVAECDSFGDVAELARTAGEWIKVIAAYPTTPSGPVS